MEKFNLKKLSIILISVTLSLMAIIVTVSFVAKSQKNEPDSWVLHSYGNNVALYNGDSIIEVYGSIMLDTLPEDDRRQLDNGIAFPTREEAVNAIEDFDG